MLLLRRWSRTRSHHGRRGCRRRRPRTLAMMLLQPLQRLLLRGRNGHRMVRVRRQSRLRVHGRRVVSKIRRCRHRIHIPLQSLHGQIRIPHLTHGLWIPRQYIRRPLWLEMARCRHSSPRGTTTASTRSWKRVETPSRCGQTGQRCRRRRCGHLA